ncbi:hypothetical protein ACHAXT_008361 [Thalassiosira profunda]
MAESPEGRPLLAAYGSLKPTGRGKARFEARQQMRKGGRSKKSVFRSLFAAQRHKSRKAIVSSSPAKVGGKAIDNKLLPNALSIDQEGGEAAPGTSAPLRPRGKHSWLYDTLNPKSSSPSARIFQKIITAVILLDSVVYILSTEPGLAHLSYLFYLTEGVTSTIFAIEYIARLWVCNEKKCCAKYGPIKGRWKFMCTSQMLIDAFATFPFFIELLLHIPMPTLTYLRVFRLLRITRTQSYTTAMDAVGRVLYFNREILLVAGMLGMYLVVVTSVLMYYLRPQGKDAENVDDLADFSSIAKTMILSILMLTGQGGPSGNLPWYTQCVVLLTGLFSIGMFAIPASMLTWGFEAEAERLGAKAKKRAQARRRGEVYRSDTSSSSSESSDLSGFGDLSTSDEEYLKVIGGDDDDGDDNPEVSNRQSSSLVPEERAALIDRIDRLEQTVARTNASLDRVLQKLELREAGRGMIAGGGR